MRGFGDIDSNKESCSSQTRGTTAFASSVICAGQATNRLVKTEATSVRVHFTPPCHTTPYGSKLQEQIVGKNSAGEGQENANFDMREYMSAGEICSVTVWLAGQSGVFPSMPRDAKFWRVVVSSETE